MSVDFSVIIELPADFRSDDVLEFHRRDRAEVVESVQKGILQKGSVWNGYPACLCIRFYQSRAEVTLSIDVHPMEFDGDALLEMAKRMLGLNQAIEAFEETYRQHPQLGRLIERQAGLRVPLAAKPFIVASLVLTLIKIKSRLFNCAKRICCLFFIRLKPN